MELLARGARELGISLTAHQLAQFEGYYQELARWNQRMNLTAITHYPDVQVKHFLDSLTLCLAVPGGPSPGARVIDVGAGAGFPGLPLKLAFPDIDLTLAESTGKKAAFLRHVVETPGLSGVTVQTGRAEELGRLPDLRESFDLVVSRGLARLPTLLEYTLPFCRCGGLTVTFKHGDVQQEVASAANALATLGGRLAGVHPVRVSGLTDDRVVVAVAKVWPTPDRFPRRPGLPAKRHL